MPFFFALSSEAFAERTVAAINHDGAPFGGGKSDRVLFWQARLFGGTSNTLQAGAQVLVEGNTITSVDTANNPCRRRRWRGCRKEGGSESGGHAAAADVFQPSRRHEEFGAVAGAAGAMAEMLVLAS